MSATPPPLRAVRFGPFELDLQTGELRRSGLKVRLQEQSFRVLAALVSRPGDLVTRAELQAALWPDGVFLDQEHGLNLAVAKLRRALHDAADAPRYIETLERRGYRFVAPVAPLPAGAGSSDGRAEPRLVRLLWGRRSMALSEGVHLAGRDPALEIWVDSPLVSRRHLAFTVAASRITVEDLGSRNGTLVNGDALTSPRDLADGDVVTLGPARFVIRSESAPGSTRIVRRQ